MIMQMLAGYRASMFDGLPGVNWLRPGWRGLRLYGRKAKIAIIDGNMLEKADMLCRADELLTLLTGILETDPGSTLGPVLMNIYGALRATLLRANINDDVAALDEYDAALVMLDQQMMQDFEGERAA